MLAFVSTFFLILANSMKQVSSSLTLVLKIAYPILWGIFWGCLSLVFLLKNDIYFGPMPLGAFRVSISIFFVSSMAIIYWTFGRLKRVEMDEEFVYVSNFWKTARYPWHNIESITETTRVYRTINISFKTPGVFGKQIFFLPSKRYRLFKDAHPQIINAVGQAQA